MLRHLQAYKYCLMIIDIKFVKICSSMLIVPRKSSESDICTNRFVNLRIVPCTYSHMPLLTWHFTSKCTAVSVSKLQKKQRSWFFNPHLYKSLFVTSAEFNNLYWNSRSLEDRVILYMFWNRVKKSSFVISILNCTFILWYDFSGKACFLLTRSV